MQSGKKMFTVDKFLGINEAADADTELKMGEASVMENWAITDGFNITLRPGIRRVDFGGDRDARPILATWAGFVGETEYFVICDFYATQDRLWVYGRPREESSFGLEHSQVGALGLSSPDGAMVKIFSFAGKLYVMSRENTVVYSDGAFAPATFYIPKVIIDSAPGGGGTTLENLNMLTHLRRVDFSADGTATDYYLPAESTGVTEITIDNVPQVISEVGYYSDHIFHFNTAPEEGVGNVEMTYTTSEADTDASRLRIAAMPIVEAYNGSTDTRLFLAGDGSNICYYSGVPESGDLTQLYFPAMNEVAVDMSDSPIMGLKRHYSKLLVFKPDGTFSITYEPVTLTDGNTIAGFFLRNMNSGFGSDVLNQVAVVSNYPRTVSNGSLIEWRITTSGYKDERYAQRISDMVKRTLQKADFSRIIMCDDEYAKTFYLFLNDDAGTVLVNRYAMTKEGLWCVYRSPLCRNVTSAQMCNGVMVFCNEEEGFWFDTSAVTDAPLDPDGEPLQIKANWESGYMAFGADFRRKYSSHIYVSIQPEGQSELIITASTDRREDYMDKSISTNLFSWNTVTFPDWTFALNTAPKINRIRLKVKKFVYYKLIFRIEKYGAVATVLGYDQEVRFSSMAK